MIVAILETMWDWRSLTSEAGYKDAVRFFRINPQNVSGKRLYKLVGTDADLWVTNACRELVTGPSHHGKPNPEWLSENLKSIDSLGPIDLLLVCGKVAQATFKTCGYVPIQARVLEIPHPAARNWTKERIMEVQNLCRD